MHRTWTPRGGEQRASFLPWEEMISPHIPPPPKMPHDLRPLPPPLPRRPLAGAQSAAVVIDLLELDQDPFDSDPVDLDARRDR